MVVAQFCIMIARAFAHIHTCVTISYNSRVKNGESGGILMRLIVELSLAPKSASLV